MSASWLLWRIVYMYRLSTQTYRISDEGRVHRLISILEEYGSSRLERSISRLQDLERFSMDGGRESSVFS